MQSIPESLATSMGLSTEESELLNRAMAAKPHPAGHQQISKDVRAAKAKETPTKGPKASGRSQSSKELTTPKKVIQKSAKSAEKAARPLATQKKNIHSRAYHRTLLAERRAGVDDATAKERAQAAAKKAVMEMVATEA